MRASFSRYASSAFMWHSTPCRHYSRGLQLAPASTALLVSRASAYMQV